jgi:hypothetical protein
MTAFTFNSIADLVAGSPGSGDTANVLGFYAPGDEGGGAFFWDAASTATAIPGLIVADGGGGTGRWIRLHGGTIGDKMCGAKVDGATHDDAAIKAMADYVTAYDDCRTLEFAPGSRKVIPVGATYHPFQVSGIDGLVFVFPDCEFHVSEDQEIVNSNKAVFNFADCRRVKFIGMPRFIADDGYTQSYIETHDTIGGKGTLPVNFAGDCSYAEVEVYAEGMLLGVNFVRYPRLTVHPIRPARIAVGGTGYVVGDVLTLSNIGSAATTNATFTVASVSSGAITAITATTRGVFPFDQGANGLNISQAGFAVSGGTGTGALILPYMADYDIEQGNDHARFCRVGVIVRLCYYGLHCNYNLSDSEFWVDGDFVYRVCVHYGGQRNNVGRVRLRNTRGDSVAVSCNQGLGTELDLQFTQLPTTSSTFANYCSPINVAWGGGMPGEVRLRVTFDVEVDAAASLGNYFGSLLEVDKSAKNGSDATYARGHIADLRIGGRIVGKGRLDSGLGVGQIIGTNVSLPSSAWNGELLSWQFEDGFIHEGEGNIVVNAKALTKLVIGNIRSDGRLSTEDMLTPANKVRFEPTGPVTIDPGAAFRNRYTATVFDTCAGDIVVAADFPASANLAGTRYNAGGGTGTTLAGSLPPALAGLQYEFVNGTRTAGSELHIDPSGTQIIRDGAAVGGAGKKWRLTGLGASVKLQCFHATEWSIVSSHGTQSIEP